MRYILAVLVFFPILKFAQTIDSSKIKSTGIVDTLLNQNSIPEDSTKFATKIDTLNPIYEQPFAKNDNFIVYKNIIRMNYRYIGNLFNFSSFNFTRDLGFPGQPNETVLYGTGFGGISYFENGVLSNNRLTNSLDLNKIQSEGIDSIEIVRLPRGFLFGPYNNQVSINFISRDFIASPPYSRIKYYQGANGEAMIDGFFNTLLYKKLNASFEITNRRMDSSYTNNSFSHWQTRLNLKYFLNDKINITGTFRYITSRVGLNGGVDLNQLTIPSTGINDTIYNASLAPVVFPNRTEHSILRDYRIKLSARFNESISSEAAFYFRSNFDGTSQSTDSTFAAYSRRDHIAGIHTKQVLDYNPFNINILANYEHYKINYDEQIDSIQNSKLLSSSVLSGAAIISLNLLRKKIIPSVFYKISHNSDYVFDTNKSGIGADLSITPNEHFLFYAGYSSFKNDAANNNITNFEISASFKTDNLKFNLSLFSRRNFIPSYLIKFSQYNYINNEDLDGFSATFNLHFWKILLENTGVYYSNKSSTGNLSIVPDYTYRGAIYYENMLFKSSLNLRAGLAFFYNGKRQSFSGNTITVDPNSRLDLTINGIIQKVAIVYFTWENLLGTNYFIVPYYPMPGRNIRFGIAWELFN